MQCVMCDGRIEINLAVAHWELVWLWTKFVFPIERSYKPAGSWFLRGDIYWILGGLLWACCFVTVGGGWGGWLFHQWARVLPDFAACQTDPNKTVWLFCGHQLRSACAASDCSALVALCLAVWYSWGMALLQLLLGALWHRHRLLVGIGIVRYETK